MSLAELEGALNGAKERLHEMERELSEYRKTIAAYLAEFAKRQRQLERDFGFVTHAPAERGNAGAGGRRKRAGRGTVADLIVEALGSASSPISVDDIVTLTGAKSKPSIAQTLMKLIQGGRVQRYNKDGKPISKSDQSQRAKSYSLA